MKQVPGSSPCLASQRVASSPQKTHHLLSGAPVLAPCASSAGIPLHPWVGNAEKHERQQCRSPGLSSAAPAPSWVPCRPALGEPWAQPPPQHSSPDLQHPAKGLNAAAPRPLPVCKEPRCFPFLPCRTSAFGSESKNSFPKRGEINATGSCSEPPGTWCPLQHPHSILPRARVPTKASQCPTWGNRALRPRETAQLLINISKLLGLSMATCVCHMCLSVMAGPCSMFAKSLLR